MINRWLTCIALIAIVALPASVRAQHPATWLIVVDDLHLDFANTGRLRDLLRLLMTEVVQHADSFAIRSTGPSKLRVEMSQDRAAFSTAIKYVVGNGLKPSDMQQGGVAELRYRAEQALAVARDAITTIQDAPAGRIGMIYVSNGYPALDLVRDRAADLARVARENNVRIFAIDPRELAARVSRDPAMDQAAWDQHLQMTRETLRLLTEPTGGGLVFETASVSQSLREISVALRQ